MQEFLHENSENIIVRLTIDNTIHILWDGPQKKTRLGCAQEYNNDPNSPDYGCLHIPYYPNLPPYDNPIYYDILNDGEDSDSDGFCDYGDSWPNCSSLS